MGSCMAAGDDDDKRAKAKATMEKAKSKSIGDDDKEEAKGKESAPKAPRLEFEGGKEKLNLGFPVTTPPIVTQDGNIVFLYTKDKTTKKAILNVNECKISESIEVKCDENFNIEKTVYALNENDNKIYFIERNARILTLDLNEESPSIEPLNKTIETDDDNYAQIGYSKATKKLYILGAEEKSDKDENYELVPYSTCVKFVDKGDYQRKIRGFGQFSRVLAVNTIDIITKDTKAEPIKDPESKRADYLYVMGGIKPYPTGGIVPEDLLCKYILNNDADRTNDKNQQSTQKWQQSYTAQPILRNGIINYEDRFLISFGGTIVTQQKQQDKSYNIYVLILTDKEEKYGLKENVWYELKRKLPEKKRYFNAVYISGDKVVHLFSYRGEYFTLDIKTIIDEIEIGETRKDGGVDVKQIWSEQGKTVTPTKTPSIKNLGPTGDSDDEDDKK